MKKMKVKLREDTGKTSAVVHIGNRGYELDCYAWTEVPDMTKRLFEKHLDIYEIKGDEELSVKVAGKDKCPNCGKMFKNLARHKCKGVKK